MVNAHDFQIVIAVTLGEALLRVLVCLATCVFMCGMRLRMHCPAVQ